MMPAVITALAPLLGDLLDRAFPDSEARERARLEVYARMQESLNQLDMAQVEVNKAEASHASIFVAGWRPFIGWVCGIAFAYHTIAQPLLVFGFAAYGRTITTPVFDMDALGWVLGGMLGLGTMRTVEKVKGVTMGLSGQLPWRPGK